MTWLYVPNSIASFEDVSNNAQHILVSSHENGYGEGFNFCFQNMYGDPHLAIVFNQTDIPQLRHYGEMVGQIDVNDYATVILAAQRSFIHVESDLRVTGYGSPRWAQQMVLHHFVGTIRSHYRANPLVYGEDIDNLSRLVRPLQEFQRVMKES